MIVENIHFHNNKNQRIAGRIYRGEIPSKEGVIFCHGLFSSKDAHKITWMAEYIINAGYTLQTFDFSFVGESEGHISELSILQEVEDLRSAINYFNDNWTSNVHLIGSSVGGVVSLLFSSENCASIKSLTLIATPVNLVDLMLKNTDVDELESLSDDGMTSIDGVPIKNSFIKEIRYIKIEEAVLQINFPTLIIHGRDDQVVDVSNAEFLDDNLKSEKKLILIEDGDHNLTRESDLNILKDNIIDWLNQNS